MAPLVGASKSEVAVKETLTANLDLLMASFYRPTKEGFKIKLEGKAFPSDCYAVESQIRHRNYDQSGSRRAWARVGVDDLMLVRGEVIIPHHYELYYYCIVNKTLGPTNIPLFDYASTLPAANAE